MINQYFSDEILAFVLILVILAQNLKRVLKSSKGLKLGIEISSRDKDTLLRY